MIVESPWPTPRVPPAAGVVETRERPAALRDPGAITNEEWQASKTQVMNNAT
jgi:hypothetical protein